MRILLLTDIPPNKVYPAALVLDTLCRLLPHDSLACFCVVNPILDKSVTPDLDWLPIQFSPKPKELTHRFPTDRWNKATELLNLAWETYISVKKIPQIAAAAIQFGRQQGCDVVWCVLEGQTLIRLAKRVADGLGVPLRTQVFDPPDRWLYIHRVNGYSSRQIYAEYESALRHSQSCATASWAMAEEFNRKYQIKAIPVIPSLKAEMAIPPKVAWSPHDPFIIGTAGQFYADDEWQALLAALESVNWQIAGREVKLWIFGHKLNLVASTSMNVEFFGWSPQTEVIAKLSKASVLYFAYWFTHLFEESARLSFPSKLVSYLAAGRPVLFHGPDYASPHKFLTQHRAGLSCHSLQSEEIIHRLTQLATDQRLCSELAENGARAFHKELTVDTMRRSFADFLEVDESTLLPTL